MRYIFFNPTSSDYLYAVFSSGYSTSVMPHHDKIVLRSKTDSIAVNGSVFPSQGCKVITLLMLAMGLLGVLLRK